MRDLYKVGAVRRLTGFSPELLRAWERRYGILKPVRGKGGQRLYTTEDLRLLHHIRRLLAQGRSIGELAALGREALLSSSAESSGAGTTPAAEELQRLREVMLEAVRAVDASGLQQALDEVFARLSPEVAIERILEPAARQIGELWASGQCSIAGEHMATQLFAHRLRRLIEAAAVRASDRSALTACFPDENHELGLLMVGYELARRGFRVVHLGQALPLADLGTACRSVRPDVVVLSVTLPATFQANRDALADLIRSLPGIRWIVGGQGAPREDAVLASVGVRLWPAGSPLRELGRLLR